MTAVLLMQAGLLLVLILLSGFFSSAEVAFFALNPVDVNRLKELHPRTGTQVAWIRSSPTRFLSTILIGNTLVNVAIPALLYALAVPLLGNRAEAAAMAIAFLVLLIYGEIGPKRIAVAYPERLARFYAAPLRFLIVVLSPLRLMLTYATRVFARLIPTHARALTDKEFKTVVDLGEEAGTLQEDERDMLQGIIRLEDLKASDVMTPRVDLIAYDLDDPPDGLNALARRARVRNVVLYREQLDHMVGTLDVRSYLLDPDHRIGRAMRPPLYIPEACPLDQLLKRFLRERRRVAVVVDEYGGTAGVVTRGDILEEIVGDIADEKGGHELLLEQLGPRRWMLDGGVNLETLSDRFNLVFEEEGVDRIAGWITAQLERMPRPGDRVQLNEYQFIVRQMRRHRIALVEMIQPLEDPA